MKRRDFLKNVPLAIVPLFSNKLFAAPMSLTMAEAALFNNAIGEDRIFVIVQMDGGNDGLNTVLPLDQYTNLAAARSNILIPDTSALVLGNFQTGLHPAMTGMKSLYDQNLLCVVQGVSYASPNQSHFRSGDIFTSGSDANVVLDTGWVGRYLEYAYPNFPSAYPNATMPDPLSIQIGSSVSRGLMGYDASTAQLVPSTYTGGLAQLQSFQNTTTPGSNAGDEIAFLRAQHAFADQYAVRINNAYSAGTSTQTYSGGTLGQQLKIVARLIKGGLKTKVYWVRQGGYDTHNAQVDSANKTQGTHANLLAELSGSIQTFMNDIIAMGLEDQVMGMTFSEFGRRVKSNGSTGTDHGTAGPMFVFGKHVNPTVLGVNAVIPATSTSSTYVPTQFDYRQIYQAMLQGWFCVPSGDAASILGSQTPLSATDTSCLFVLPLEFLKFVAEKANKNDAHIEWITATEQNVLRFEVERSVDGVAFKKIGTLPAKGHSHEPIRYEYLDKDLPLAKNLLYYYRLRIVEADGVETKTEIRTVRFENTNTLSADIYPNPNHEGLLHIRLNGELIPDSTLEIILTDSFGRRILHLRENGRYAVNNQVDLNLDSISQDGIYFISIIHEAHAISQKIVIQR